MGTAYRLQIDHRVEAVYNFCQPKKCLDTCNCKDDISFIYFAHVQVQFHNVTYLLDLPISCSDHGEC